MNIKLKIILGFYLLVFLINIVWLSILFVRKKLTITGPMNPWLFIFLFSLFWPVTSGMIAHQLKKQKHESI